MKFAQSIIAWYDENKRVLPWRETNDPYKIWLSENPQKHNFWD